VAFSLPCRLSSPFRFADSLAHRLCASLSSCVRALAILKAKSRTCSGLRLSPPRRDHLECKIHIPPDLLTLLDRAWSAAGGLPGFLTEAEARFLALAAACAPGAGAIVEIGSFKGKSAVVLATIARHYGLGPVVAIDPHTFANPELAAHRAAQGASSFEDFLSNLNSAGVADTVEIHRAHSTEIAPAWTRPIRLLWIDGNHTWAGAKADFDGFMPHLVPGGVVAFHDALHLFSGPIRVFADDVLSSDRFGAAGFVGSIAWAQFRPHDGAQFRSQRAALERRVRPLLPFVKGDRSLGPFEKLRYKLLRARVPRAAITPDRWAALLESPDL
jgi:predicted O-methyltransferase YrrM